MIYMPVMLLTIYILLVTGYLYIKYIILYYKYIVDNDYRSIKKKKMGQINYDLTKPNLFCRIKYFHLYSRPVDNIQWRFEML